MPDTAKGWGVNPNKPRQALDAAAKHMAGYVHQFGSYENALRAYNAGPGNVKASHGFSETNNYVKTSSAASPPQGRARARPAGRSGVTGLRFGKDQIGTRKSWTRRPSRTPTRKAQVGAWYASKHPGSILARVLPQTPPDEADFTSSSSPSSRAGSVVHAPLPSGGRTPPGSVSAASCSPPLPTERASILASPSSASHEPSPGSPAGRSRWARGPTTPR
jgi:hypothetical protein